MKMNISPMGKAQQQENQITNNTTLDNEHQSAQGFK